jgi:hypothetical protein
MDSGRIISVIGLGYPSGNSCWSSDQRRYGQVCRSTRDQGDDSLRAQYPGMYGSGGCEF